MGVRERLRQLIRSTGPPKSDSSASTDDIERALDAVRTVQTAIELSPAELVKLVDPKNLELLESRGRVNGIASQLSVDLQAGLPDSDRAASQFRYGCNVLPIKEPPTLLQLMLSAFLDKTLLMLTAAALVSLGIGLYQDARNGTMTHWIEGAAILIAVAIVVLVNALNDWQREKQFRKLNARAEDRLVNILKGGRPTRISIFDLAVGDVCLLEPGVRTIRLSVR